MIAPQLLSVPMQAFLPIDIREANRLLLHFRHKLGPVERPFRQEAFGMFVDDRPVGVVVSASTVSDTVAGEIDGARVEWRRDEVVELARLAGERWCSRVLIRLWRELCAPRWELIHCDEPFHGDVACHDKATPLWRAEILRRRGHVEAQTALPMEIA